MLAVKKIAIAHVFYLSILFSFAGIYAALGVLDGFEKEAKLLHFNNIVMGAVLTIATFYMFKKLNGKNSKEMGFGLSKKDRYFALFALAVALLATVAFTALFGKEKSFWANVKFSSLKDKEYLLVLALAIVGWWMAALKEEVLSRGLVLFNLRGLKVETIIILSAVLFMLLHVPTNGTNPFKMVSWFLGGLAYAYVYIKSGSIIVSTIVHAIHNFMNDWLFGSDSGFAIIELSRKIEPDEKLFYEMIIKTALVLATYLFYYNSGIKVLQPLGVKKTTDGL